MTDFNISTLATTLAEGSIYSFSITPSASLTEAITVRWEIIPNGKLPVSAEDFVSFTGRVDFAASATVAQTVNITPTDDAAVEPTQNFEIRVYQVETGAADILLGTQAVTLTDDDTGAGAVAVTPASNTEGNVNTAANTQDFALNAKGGDDTYIITRFQSGDVKIAESAGTDLIKFDFGVEIVKFAEISTSNFTRLKIESATLTLSTGAEIEIEFPARTTSFQLGDDAIITSYAAFKTAIGASGTNAKSALASHEVTTFTTTPDVSANTIAVAAEVLESSGLSDVIGLGSVADVSANGAGGDDIFVVTRFQSGDVMIDDTVGTNIVKFDYGVSITGFSEASRVSFGAMTISLATLTLSTGAEIAISFPAGAFNFQLGDAAVIETYAAFKIAIGASLSNADSALAATHTVAHPTVSLPPSAPVLALANGDDAGATQSATVAENTPTTTAIIALPATDVDGGVLTYALEGDDAVLFDISATGALTFKASPDFEGSGDNEYDVTVKVTDTGGLSDSTDVTVTVTNANEETTGAVSVGTNTATVTINGIVFTAKAGGDTNAATAIEFSNGTSATNIGHNFRAHFNEFQIGYNSAYTGSMTLGEVYAFLLSNADITNSFVLSTNADYDENADSVLLDSSIISSGGTDYALTQPPIIVGVVLTAVTATIADVDDATLTFAYQWKLDGTNVATGGTAKTYTTDAVGTYTVDVTATDSVHNVSTVFTASTGTIVLADNAAPVLDNPIADQTLDEDTDLDFTFPLNSFSDDDAGDTITYTAKLADESDLPTWLTFNADDRQFTGTPDNDDTGEITVRVTATDVDLATVFDDFKITVTPIDDAPTGLSLDNRVATVREDRTASFKVADITVADVDGGFDYDALTGDDAALFEIIGNALYLKANPGLDFESAKKSLAVTVAVTGTAFTEVFTIEVSNVNEGTAALGITGVSQAGRILTAAVTAVDPDGLTSANYTYQWQSQDAIAGSWADIANATATTYTLAASDAGKLVRAQITYIDGGGANEEANSAATVAVLAAPTLAFANVQSLTENAETTTRTIVADITVTNGDAGFTYSALAGADAALFEIVGNALYFRKDESLDFETTATYDVTVSLTAAVTGLVLTKSLAVAVTNVEEGDATFTIGGTEQAGQTLQISVTTADPDGVNSAGYAYQWEVQEDGAGPWVTITSRPVGTGTESHLSVGRNDLNDLFRAKVTYTDNFGKAITVTTDPTGPIAAEPIANVAPVLTEYVGGAIIGEEYSVSVNEGVQRVASFVATDENPGNVTYYELSGADAALFDIITNGDPSNLPGGRFMSLAYLTFLTPPDFESLVARSHDNIYSVTVTVYDDTRLNVGRLQDSTNVIVTVLDINEAPIAEIPIDPQIATEDRAFNLIVTDGKFSDPDVGDQLTYTAALVDGNDVPSWLKFAEGVFSGMPLNGDDGEFAIRVTARDKLGLTVTSDFTLTVNAVDDAAISLSLDNAVTSVREDTTARHKVADITVTDIDGGFAYDALAGADAALFEIVGNVLYLKAGTALDGDGVNTVLDVTVAVTGTTLSKSLAITVQDVNNNKPVFTSSGAASVFENIAPNVDFYTAAATPDVDGQAVVYSLFSAGDRFAFSVDSVTGEVSFTISPTYTVKASYTAFIDATITADGLTQVARQGLTVTVKDDAPTINSTSDTTGSVKEDTPLSTSATGTVTAFTPKSDPLVYTETFGASQDATLNAIGRFSVDASTGAWNYQLNGNEAKLNAAWVAAGNTGNFDAGDSLSVVYAVLASDGTESATQNVTVTINGVTEILGTSAADTLGDASVTVDTVTQGAAAADTIIVGTGNNVIIGGTGNDIITGGSGADTFIHRFSSRDGGWINTDGADTINNFQAGRDKLVLVDIDGNTPFSSTAGFVGSFPEFARKNIDVKITFEDGIQVGAFYTNRVNKVEIRLSDAGEYLAINLSSDSSVTLQGVGKGFDRAFEAAGTRTISQNSYFRLGEWFGPKNSDNFQVIGEADLGIVPLEVTANRAPVRGTATIIGTPTLGEKLTAITTGIKDADGLGSGAFSYQWLRGGEVISGATARTYTVVAGDAGKSVTVRISYTDGGDTADNAVSVIADTRTTASVEVRYDDEAAPTDKPNVGEELSARVRNVIDPDDSTPTLTYQWQIQTPGTSFSLPVWNDISGATSRKYIAAAEGNHRVVVTAEDSVNNVSTSFFAELNVVKAFTVLFPPATYTEFKIGVGALADTLNAGSKTSAQFIQGGALVDTITGSNHGDGIAGGYGSDIITLSGANNGGGVDKVIYRFDSSHASGWQGVDGSDTINNFKLNQDQVIFVDTATNSIKTLAAFLTGAAGADGVLYQGTGVDDDNVSFTLGNVAYSGEGIPSFRSLEIKFATAGTNDGTNGDAGSTLTLNFSPRVDFESRGAVTAFNLSSAFSVSPYALGPIGIYDSAGSLRIKTKLEALPKALNTGVIAETTAQDPALYILDDGAEALGYDIL